MRRKTFLPEPPNTRAAQKTWNSNLHHKVRKKGEPFLNRLGVASQQIHLRRKEALRFLSGLERKECVHDIEKARKGGPMGDPIQ